MLLSERPDKIILRGKYRRCSNQHYHNIPGLKAAANQNMAQQTVAGILIIGTDFKRFQHTADSANDLIRFFILDQTGLYRHYDVTVFLIDSGNNIASAVTVKNGVNFISVMKWFFHSNYSLNPGYPL